MRNGRILSMFGMDDDTVGKNNRVGVSARVLAFRVVVVFIVGALVGSMSPESGNVLALYLKMPYASGHFFNPLFLAIGIVGIGVALFARHR